MKIRLHTPQLLAKGEIVNLDKSQSHYISKVLRCGVGDEVFLFNAENGEFRGRVNSKTEILLAEQTIPPEQERGLTLIFAPVKFGKIDFLAQKATELGVTKLQPVQTKYTQVSRINYERLTANAVEAAEQTGRISVPEVAEIVDLEKLIGTWDAEKPIILCDDSLEAEPIATALAKLPAGDVAVLIGPEGGFAPEETKYLKSRKFIIPVTMGKRLLRAETAALAALAVIQANVGDWK